MFSQSKEKLGINYKNYIGDGDSKTFQGIVVNNPTVKKKECIDHVQKRMGTRLRNKKKITKGLGGRGKLTGNLIDKLTIYYGLAIRRNSDSIENMRREIWATLYHKLSTDKKPQHQFCPEGPKSWCSWQKSKFEKDLANYKHKPALPLQVFNAIKPIYKDFSTDDLLSRCLGGYTQNSNESFNSLVWSIAPKTVSSGKTVLEIATNLTVGIYNDGYFSVMQVLQELGVTIGENCQNFCEKVDSLRIKLSDRSLTEEAQEARRVSTSSRKEDEQENLETEGQLYGAGIAQ